MSDGFKSRLGDGRVWRRGFFMLLFAVAFGVVEFLVTVLAVFQFLSALFTGRPNERLAGFGDSLAVYLYQLTAFLTARSDRRPFPFDDWPQGVTLVEVEEVGGRGPGVER